jgi:hypothetical protein
MRVSASFEDRQCARILGPGFAHARKRIVHLGKTLVQRLDTIGELANRRFDGDVRGRSRRLLYAAESSSERMPHTKAQRSRKRTLGR